MLKEENFNLKIELNNYKNRLKEFESDKILMIIIKILKKFKMIRDKLK